MVVRVNVGVMVVTGVNVRRNSVRVMMVRWSHVPVMAEADLLLLLLLL